MKRAYPYAAAPPGAVNAQQPQQPSATSVPDYSAYGYGSTPQSNAGASTSNDAQQAQWHQQWQQYYAQQAAAAAASNSPAQASAGSVTVRPNNAQQSGAYGYGPPVAQPQMPQQYQQQQHQPMARPPQHQQQQQPPPQQQQQQQQQAAQQQFYGQYSPQQPQVGQGAPSYGNWNGGQPQAPYPNAGQPAGYPMQARPTPNMHHSPVLQSPQQPQQGYYGGTAPSPPVPANKRARTDNGGYGPHAPGMHGYPSAAAPIHAGHGMPAPAKHGAWQAPQQHSFPGAPQSLGAPIRGPSGQQQHPIPGRPQIGLVTAPHAGGPSNMAAPMANSARNLNVPPRPMGQRQGRNQQDNGRGNRGGGGGGNAGAPNSSGKFNGPVGVNALGPVSGMSRPAPFGQRNAQTPRKGAQSGMRGASGSVAGSRGSRADASDDESVRGGPVPKGPAGAKTPAESGLEMEKAPLLQGRTSTPVDQPVPITAKRTFTDFRISGIEIDPIQWQWQRDDDDSAEAHADAPEAAGDTKDQNGSASNRSKRNRRRKAKPRSQKQDGTGAAPRMRITFVANPPPANAPTGPKALSRAPSVDEKGDEEAAKPETTDDTNVQENSVKAQSSELIDWSAFSKAPPQCSANRMTISYGSSKRRLVIDSDVVKNVEVNRAQGTVRITIDVVTGVKQAEASEMMKGEEWVVAKGVILEARKSEGTNFAAVPRSDLERCWLERRGSTAVKADDEDDDAEGEDINMNKPHTAQDGELEQKTDADEKPSAEEKTLSEETETAVIVKSEDQVVAGDGVATQVAASATPGVSEPVVKDSAEDAKAEEEDRLLDDYESLPPFYRLLTQHEGPAEDAGHVAAGASEMTITLFLDDSANEAKWIRTGDVAEWLSVLPGVQTSLSTDPLRTWITKVRVMDPDPPPTLAEVFDEWVKKSIAGTAVLRRQFLQDSHLTTAGGLTDVFARLIVAAQGGDRGAASLPSSTASPSPVAVTPNSKELGKLLQDSLTSSSFEAHHTHVSLAVISLVGLARELAGPTDDVVAERLQGLLLCMPMHLIFRSLDDLCKDALEKQRHLQAKSRRNKQQAQSRNGGINAATPSVTDEGEGERGAGVETSSRAMSVDSAAVDGLAGGSAQQPNEPGRRLDVDQMDQEEQEAAKPSVKTEEREATIAPASQDGLADAWPEVHNDSQAGAGAATLEEEAHWPVGSIDADAVDAAASAASDDEAMAENSSAAAAIDELLAASAAGE